MSAHVAGVLFEGKTALAVAVNLARAIDEARVDQDAGRGLIAVLEPGDQAADRVARDLAGLQVDARRLRMQRRESYGIAVAGDHDDVFTGFDAEIAKKPVH